MSLWGKYLSILLILCLVPALVTAKKDDKKDKLPRIKISEQQHLIFPKIITPSSGTAVISVTSDGTVGSATTAEVMDYDMQEARYRVTFDKIRGNDNFTLQVHINNIETPAGVSGERAHVKINNTQYRSTPVTLFMTKQDLQRGLDIRIGADIRVSSQVDEDRYRLKYDLVVSFVDI